MRILVLLVCGCTAAESDRAGRFPVSLTAQTAENDEVVASVDGRPIHTSDVAIQARATHTTARVALDALIEAEALASEAQRRGLDKDRDAEEAAQATAVRRLLAAGFEREVTAPAVPMSLIKKVYEKNRMQYDHDLEIDVWHVLVQTKNLKPDEKTAARAAAEEIARRAKGLDLKSFKQLAKTAPTGKSEHIVTEKDGWVLKEFSYPAFEQLKKPGDTSSVIETSYGYHVLHLVGYIPARHTTLAEAEPELRQGVFPEFQRPEFIRYCLRVAGDHAVDVHPERIK